MTTEKEKYTSPVMTVASANLARAKEFSWSKGKQMRSIRLLGDTTNPEHAKFKQLIESINPACISTFGTTSETEYVVRLKTEYNVSVTDANGEFLTEKTEAGMSYENVPRSMNNDYDNVTARAEFTVSRAGQKPGLYLNGVQLVSVELGEAPQSSGVNTSELRQKVEADQLAS